MEGETIMLPINACLIPLIFSTITHKWYVLISSIQKAVRVTTLMKRLRAPDQSDSGASSPALGASAGSVISSSTPVAMAATPEPPGSTLELQQIRAGEAPARCNGEIPAPLQLSVETREEQNG